jgi:subtilisin family serine protease
MPKGYSLHIGVNKFNREVYGDGLSFLYAAVNDAVFWEKYAKDLGYVTAPPLLDEDATEQAVLDFLQGKAKILNPGDILLITYSGHGGQVMNSKRGVRESERYDQTWCLYDGQLLDDELYACFQQFAEGVRITIVSDSCHSGTVARDEPPPGTIDLSTKLQRGFKMGLEARGCVDREMSREAQQEYWHRGGGEKIKTKQKQFSQSAKAQKVKAAVTLLAACQDDESTFDGEELGLFTGALKSLLNDNHADANAAELIAQVKTMYGFPKPNLFTYGAKIATYKTHSPFAIDIPDFDQIEGFEQARVRNTVPDARGSSKSLNARVRITAPADFDPISDAQLSLISSQVVDGKKIVDIELLDMPIEEAWNAAHALQAALKADGIEVQVEPIYFEHQKTLSREGRADSDDYLPEWPPAQAQPTVKVGWHLDEEHSQLAGAVKTVRQKWQDNPPRIRIAHIDTGYVPNRPGLPKYLKHDEGRSFIPGENSAIDPPDSGQDRHGTGTMILLAGDQVGPKDLFGEYEGEVGGIPFAEVIPLRISETVVIFNSNRFEAAVEAAIELGCEVITMSMAGKPSPGMSKVINKAYEAGIVVVSAASNCWYKGPGAVLPKCVLYPAAFPRVIAAVGAMQNQLPYDQKFLLASRSKIDTAYMQGCWGPASRMKYALAAYTPNVPWVGKDKAFTRGGGGTSSATPQVAAAAALWIAHYRKELEAKGYYKEGQRWKKVEAVRHALFNSANRTFPEWQKYYGNGILRALDALRIGVPDEQDLQAAPAAKVSPLGVAELVVSFFKNRPAARAIETQPDDAQLALELIQVLESDPELFDLLERIDEGEGLEVLGAEDWKRVGRSKLASNFLRGRLG